MELNLPIVEEKKEKPLEEREVEAVKVVTIDGRQYLCHKVKLHDSLMKLSLRYNVSMQVLKGCN